MSKKSFGSWSVQNNSSGLTLYLCYFHSDEPRFNQPFQILQLLMDIDSHLIKWRCELKFCQNCLCKGSFFLIKTKKLEVHLNPPFFFIFSLKPMHLRKRKTKLFIPIYFWSTTSKFCFKIISFSSLELSFDSEDSEKKLRSSTFDNCELTPYILELWRQFAIF